MHLQGAKFVKGLEDKPGKSVESVATRSIYVSSVGCGKAQKGR